MNKRTEIENLYERYIQVMKENMRLLQTHTSDAAERKSLMSEALEIMNKIEILIEGKVFVSVKGVCFIPMDRGLEIMEIYT